MQKIMKVIIILFGILIALCFAYLIGLWFIIRTFPFAP
ncbi:hypothetical protein DFP97_109239 [Paenibacillus prosopidis]|uniref:Uncharacterized protein n=1 Tax=Paenibacillus prosopidis TaxID=630520 RepID=A0A368W1Q6_9BACL|nr:hypothetical protein DFP97_109239 [Paenibacillus prosopidis]